MTIIMAIIVLGLMVGATHYLSYDEGYNRGIQQAVDEFLEFTITPEQMENLAERASRRRHPTNICLVCREPQLGVHYHESE